MDNRGVSSVVGKALAAGLTVLYVAGMTATLLGGPVPAGERAAAGELSERVLATAGAAVESAVPDRETTATVRRTVSLPATIRDRSYRLVLRDGRLALDHPNNALDRSTRLTVPQDVRLEDGGWSSETTLVVRVAGPPDDRTLVLTSQ